MYTWEECAGNQQNYNLTKTKQKTKQNKIKI